MSHTLIALLLAVLPLTAFAAENAAPAGDIENDYAVSILHRPLVLPKGLGQAWLGVELNNNPNAAPLSGISTNPRFGVGYDMGVGTDIQLGVNALFQFSPSTEVISAFLSSQYRFSREHSMRLDAGTRLGTCGTDRTATFGLGFPLKYQLNDKVALVSGQTLGPEVWDDVVIVDYGSVCKATTIIHLPVAFLFQSDEVVAFRVGAGYRTLFGSGKEGTHFIPLRLEGVMTIEQNLDVGFGFQYSGKFGASSDADKTQYQLFENRLFIWAGYRL